MDHHQLPYTQSTDSVTQALNVNPDAGLTQSQVQERLAQYGQNELKGEEHSSLLQKFFEQFKDFMIIVLLVAAIISGFIGSIEDAIVILIVVVLNAIMGVFQEAKAEEAIDALKDMSSPDARVKRGGHVAHVKSTELVPGDIVLLEAGDIVPADMRLLEANSLQIEEAALTGESVPVEKEVSVIDNPDASLGDRTNMAYSSTSVTYGRGLGVVTGTGMDTEVGHIASMLSSTDKVQTPLQRDQEKLGKSLTIMILIVAVVTFLVGTLVQQEDPLHMLLISISLAVAAIPEGLPAISTIILSLGTQTMADRNALVRTLPAVETLGSTQVICSDKTGTLTLNQMTIEKVYYNGQVHDASAAVDLELPLMQSIVLANDASLDKTGKLIGDPTETAMIQYGIDHGLSLNDYLAKYPRVDEVPFDSDRKLMSTVHQLPDGRYLVATKGAPDQLIKRCQQQIINGTDVTLTEADRQQIEATNHQMATQALRVLAGAYKIIDEIPSVVNTDTLEQDLIFTGLVGMIDPERQEAADAIRRAKGAGIRTVMITGDHAVTAQAIAERLGLLDPNATNNERHVMTGTELDQIDDATLAQNVHEYSVYARVSPEHKVRIIRAWQANGKTVSMTGDGVNDAPSLKQADIGVGMGITGTEVAKGASDMILADDNFETIVVAVEEGRKVFANIQKAVQYLLSANLGEVVTIFTATLLGWQILEPIHILWINLVTDVFPAIALGMEQAEPDSMNHAPRTPDQSFLSFGVAPSILYQGLLEAGLTLFVYWFARYQYAPTLGLDIESGLAINTAETMAFVTLGLIQLFHAYNVKYIFNSLFTRNPFSNKWLNIAALISGILLIGVVLTPGINRFFDVSPIGTQGWIIVVAAAAMILVLVEIIKWIFRVTGQAEKYNKTLN